MRRRKTGYRPKVFCDNCRIGWGERSGTPPVPLPDRGSTLALNPNASN